MVVGWWCICAFAVSAPWVTAALAVVEAATAKAATATNESSVLMFLSPGFIVWKYNHGNRAQQIGDGKIRRAAN